MADVAASAAGSTKAAKSRLIGIQPNQTASQRGVVRTSMLLEPAGSRRKHSIVAPLRQSLSQADGTSSLKAQQVRPPL